MQIIRNDNGKDLRWRRTTAGRSAGWRFACFFVTLIITVVVLTGCSIRGETDDDFLRDMAEGLEARWDLTEKYKDEDSKEIWEELIDCEYDRIGKYRHANFRDEKLGRLAREYIGLIDESKECLKYYDDEDKFSEKMSRIYYERAAIVYRLVKSENLMVDDEYRDDVEALTDDGRTYISATGIMKRMHFQLSRVSGGKKTYEATVTNTSRADFKYFDVFIALVDKDGSVVERVTASTRNWESQTKHKLKFTTDAAFDRIEVRSCDFEEL